MNEKQIEMRAAFHLLAGGHQGDAKPAPKPEAPEASQDVIVDSLRVDLPQWIRPWAIAILILLGVLAFAAILKAEPEPGGITVVHDAFRGYANPFHMNAPLAAPATGGIVLQLKNAGTSLAIRGGGLVIFNCTGAGLSCSFSGTTFTLNGSGGAGSGCVPPGTHTGAFLIDSGTGTCPDFAGFSASAHNFVTGLSNAGVFSQAQPACGDLSNSAASCSTDATNASNISSGTLGAGRLPNPSATTLGGIESLSSVAHKWINTISTSGVPSATQPDYSDLTGVPSTFAPSAHNLLSAAHGDTTTGTVARGDLITGQGASATWTRLVKGAASTCLQMDGSAVDVLWAACPGGGGGSGTLTASGLSLPVNQIVLGNTYPDTKPLGSLGTTVTVLHGNAAGPPSFGVTTPADAAGNTSGSGNFCLVTSCTMVTPALGTPSALVLTNATALPCGALPALTGNVTTSAGSCATTVAVIPSAATATTQSSGDNSTKVATTAYVDSIPKKRALGWAFGDVATGSALTTSEIGYITVPFACTITGYHIMADAGTVTIKTARVNGGTALPTVGSNSISTSGVALSSGTKIDSSTVTDFTSTAIAANDTLGFFITAVATAKQITFQLDCTTI